MRLALGPPGMEPEVTLIVVFWFPIVKDYFKRFLYPRVVSYSRGTKNLNQTSVGL